MFKPRTLLHDATLNEFRQWQKCFVEYYQQSNMEEEDANLQRSFINTYLNDDLTNIIDREAANKNPKIYTASPAVSLMGILERHFDDSTNWSPCTPPPTKPQSAFFAEFI